MPALVLGPPSPGKAAALVDDNGKQIVTHDAGPTWKRKDGSMQVGARVASATVSDDAIPWLKLKAAGTTEGQHGGDRLRDGNTGCRAQRAVPG